MYVYECECVCVGVNACMCVFVCMYLISQYSMTFSQPPILRSESVSS